jgi:preflagellin peptidase FlaK
MGPNALLIDYIRAIISVSMLGYASYRDLKTREIHDMVWVIPGAIGVAMDAYELVVGNLILQGALLNIGFMVVLSGVLWYFSLFGEADLIAFVTLAVIQPRTPVYGFAGYTPLLFAFTLVANSAIAGVFTAFYTFAVNQAESLRGTKLFERYGDASILKRITIMFTGRYIPLHSLKGPPFEYPLEVKGKLVVRPDLFDDDEANRAFKILREKNVDHVWVSSTIPYIVVMLVGYLISVMYGDLMFTIMSLIY